MHNPLVTAIRYGSAVAAFGLLLTACGGAPDAGFQMPPPEVTVATVLQKELRAWDELSGRIAAVENVEIRPRVSGYLDRIAFQEGGSVKKGDLLFVIDPRPFEAELSRARAELVRAQTVATLAREERERADKLVAAKAISAEEFQQRLSSEKTAAAAIAVADASVRTAQLNVSYARIESPITGRIGASSMRIGNLVEPGALLTTVVSQNPMYVYFEGDEGTWLAYADSAQRGDASNAVQVGLANEKGYPHNGLLDFVDNQIDASSGTVKVRAVIDNASGKLAAGLFARVRMQGSNTQQVMLIDDRAVLTDQDRKFVYTLGPKNAATRKDVKTGALVDGLRMIESGLDAGDKIIVHGVAKVFFPGMTVKPVDIAMGDPAPVAAMGGPPAAATPVEKE
jgi:membrane fusion protein, multidrug efflux system